MALKAAESIDKCLSSKNDNLKPFIDSGVKIIKAVVFRTTENYWEDANGNYPYLEFPILLNSEKIIWVCLISIVSIISASVYPAIRASKLNPVQSIGIK